MKIKIFFMTVLSIIVFSLSCPAYACYSRDEQSASTLSIDFGDITIPNDETLPIGGVIVSKSGTLSSLGASLISFTCGSPGDSPTNVPVYISGDGTTTADATYDTNVTGVGVKFYYYSSASYGNEPTEPTPAATSFNAYLSNPYHESYGANPNASMKIELVKTANINGGVAGKLLYSKNGIVNASGFSLLNTSVSANITFPSCSLDPATKTSIDLGTTSKSELPDIGSTSNKTDFSILLNCAANPKVSVDLSGTESPDAPGQGVLALDPASTASGLGVQILFQDKPVSLNNELSVGTASSGEYSIPMQARFYRTGNTLTPGDVLSSMTYTLIYR